VIFRDILVDFSALEPAGEFFFELVFIIFDALDDSKKIFQKFQNFRILKKKFDHFVKREKMVTCHYDE